MVEDKIDSGDNVQRDDESPRGPGRYHHGRLRQALIDHALEVLDAEGPRGVTLRSLARRIGVSPAAPYRHFRDRDELLSAVAEQGYRDLERALGVAFLTESGDPERRILAVGTAYVRLALRHPGRFRLLFRKGDGAEGEGLALRAAGLAALEPLQQAVHDAWLAAGRGGGPAEAVIAAWSLLHGLATLGAEGRLEHLAGAREAEALVAGALRTLLGDRVS
jgi:AcrR family transcriptional regulator